ncbi:hypothetical protein MAR_027911 [Mya arenaria]|uniref:Uncharacterized protein n=1 Tax=Mya arenaria TaxID=6604 RepID=A0ABY7DC27_MYAAR|nr:hypothetical protein MAR_027911 [Mya arenaria]
MKHEVNATKAGMREEGFRHQTLVAGGLFSLFLAQLIRGTQHVNGMKELFDCKESVEKQITEYVEDKSRTSEVGFRVTLFQIRGMGEVGFRVTLCFKLEARAREGRGWVPCDPLFQLPRDGQDHVAVKSCALVTEIKGLLWQVISDDKSSSRRQLKLS